MAAAVRRALLALALILSPAGCARPLTDGESALAGMLFGPTIDVDRVRVVRGFGLSPLPATRVVDRRAVAPPAEACRRVEVPLDLRPPSAVALGSWIFLGPRSWSPDLAPGFPDRARLPHTLLLAHELTHVWQWQNRAATGYTPVAAAFESFTVPDPYFYEAADRPFLSYGFEQQAALVEDWLCWRVVAPDDPQGAEIGRVLRGEPAIR